MGPVKGNKSDVESNEEEETALRNVGGLSGPLAEDDPVNGDRPEANMPPVIKDPEMSRAQDMDTRNAIGHAVFGSWCEACVDGQGRLDAHKSSRERGDLPELGYKYGLLNSKDEEKVLVKEKLASDRTQILAGRDLESGMLIWHVIPQKGVNTWHLQLRPCEQIYQASDLQTRDPQVR